MVALYKQHNILDFPEPTQQGGGKLSEWYTPGYIVDAAREVMGGIDLDPASCEVANRTVKAARYYTARDNGLEQEWIGRCWLNPPYGRTNEMKARHISVIESFTSKLISSYYGGRVTQAVLLVPATIGTNWFHPLWQFPLCFHTGKLNFMSPDKHSCYSHAYGTVFAYFGPHEGRFINIFSQFGRIARAIDTTKPSPVNLTLWNGGDA